MPKWAPSAAKRPYKSCLDTFESKHSAYQKTIEKPQYRKDGDRISGIHGVGFVALGSLLLVPIQKRAGLVTRENFFEFES